MNNRSDILDDLRRNFERKSDLDRDKELLQRAYAEIGKLRSQGDEMLAVLSWAAGHVGGYTKRIRGQNDAYCDAVDRMNAAIRKATAP